MDNDETVAHRLPQTCPPPSGLPHTYPPLTPPDAGCALAIPDAGCALAGLNEYSQTQKPPPPFPASRQNQRPAGASRAIRGRRRPEADEPARRVQRLPCLITVRLQRIRRRLVQPGPGAVQREARSGPSGANLMPLVLRGFDRGTVLPQLGQGCAPLQNKVTRRTRTPPIE